MELFFNFVLYTDPFKKFLCLEKGYGSNPKIFLLDFLLK